MNHSAELASVEVGHGTAALFAFTDTVTCRTNNAGFCWFLLMGLSLAVL